MQIAPRIQFRGMEPSPAVETRIRERIDGLAQFHDRITSCNVVVDAPHRHGHKGQIYRISIDITVPGAELFVGKEAADNHAHEDVYVAVRDAFDAATRQLEDRVRRTSGHGVKPHPAKRHGEIVRLVPDEGFGFIATADGGEVFFRRESLVAGAWDRLTAGTKVRFTEHDGEQGPHATAVKVL